MKRKKSIVKIVKLIEAFSDYDVECLYFLAAMLLIRIAETIALHATDYNAELILNNLEGFLSDIAYSGKYLLAACIIYIIIHKFSQKIANIIIRFGFAICICASLMLVAYFSSTHIPLDSIITAYSPKELYVTVKANGNHNIIILCTIIAISIAFTIIPRIKTTFSKWISLTILAIMVGCIFFPGLDKNKFRYDKEYYILENKMVYLTNSIRNGNTTIQYTDSELKELAKNFAEYFPEYQFVDYKYPFLHENNCNDVLSNYFEVGAQKPNIVILICEGLCNEISGRNSKATSATPFLDSLAEHSLVWENGLSTSERTIGALPSILGALPFGNKGFMSYRRDVPDFNTIATILHDNGYANSFFYGGWYGFDGMDIFAENNFMTLYYKDKKYDTVSKRNEWGLHDEYLFEQSLVSIEDTPDKPRLDVYLTLSTHDPYDYPNSDIYSKIYDDKQKQNPDKRQIDKHITEYASFLYLDNCLREFFEKYKKIETYKNTIFIITGDHKFTITGDNNSNTPNESPIANFQVPILIWSPMLKESKRFPAITTHRNISPSILAFLAKNYKINVPSTSTSLNSGLDTSSVFRAATFSPHFSEGRNIKAITYNSHLIYGKEIYLFDIDSGNITLKKAPADNWLISLPELYTNLEKYIMNNNALSK